jgi:hypothetical protein
MATMSFAGGDRMGPHEMESSLRRDIERAIPRAHDVQDRHQWRLGILARRAFPPGQDAMVDSCRLYMSIDGMYVVYLIKGGRLIDHFGHTIDLREFGTIPLIKILTALEGIIDYEQNNQIRHHTVRPVPTPRPQRRRGFWGWVLHDLLGL